MRGPRADSHRGSVAGQGRPLSGSPRFWDAHPGPILPVPQPPHTHSAGGAPAVLPASWPGWASWPAWVARPKPGCPCMSLAGLTIEPPQLRTWCSNSRALACASPALFCLAQCCRRSISLMLLQLLLPPPPPPPAATAAATASPAAPAAAPSPSPAPSLSRSPSPFQRSRSRSVMVPVPVAVAVPALPVTVPALPTSHPLPTSSLPG